MASVGGDDLNYDGAIIKAMCGVVVNATRNLTLARQLPSTLLRLLDSFTKYTSEESGEFST